MKSRSFRQPAALLLLLMVMSVLVLATASCGKSPKEKSVEAFENLERIYDAAAAYFGASQTAAGHGKDGVCMFPPTIGCAPEGSPCGHPDNMYPADSKSWRASTWKILGFLPKGAHYFKYCFESTGTGRQAMFRAAAYADLDCDGQWSTFMRDGWAVDSDETRRGCPRLRDPTFYVENETE